MYVGIVEIMCYFPFPLSLSLSHSLFSFSLSSHTSLHHPSSETPERKKQHNRLGSPPSSVSHPSPQTLAAPFSNQT